MEKIIIDNVSGKVLKDSQGRILKDRPFNETPIQDGLVFWGQAAPEYLTIVDGLISEAYDVRGNGLKMVQNTVAERLYFANNEIYGGSVLKSLSIANQTVKSIFMVAKLEVGFGAQNLVLSAGEVNRNGLGYGMFTSGWGTFDSINYNILKPFYANNTKYTEGIARNTTYRIYHSLYDFTFNNLNMILKMQAQLPIIPLIKEWGWYNRLLSEQEVIYNINALNAKHQIF